MARTSDKKYWDDFWSASAGRGEIYSTDMRILRNLQKHVDFSGLRVLEVGAGTGRDSAAISDGGAEVCALDYSEEALKLVRSVSGEGLLIVCSDAMELPFPDECFDVVFHQGLLEHFRDPVPLLHENHRVLKKGGILLVDVPQRYHYYTVMKHLLMALRMWFAGWETEFSVNKLRQLVEEAGMDIIDIYGENLCPPIWYRGLRKILLKFGINLPMYPALLSKTGVVGRFFNRAAPNLYLNTVMVIGAIARRRQT